ncbi:MULTISPECIES: ATP phosphoribosyltransferase regulatory subunit [Anaerostipes]|uniref:ATP phosphoribosyltransferase regulatory subunit n=1 Tax=Anaerostipes TaxID=207244 RepID=UPI000951723D|nr:MULTISPECIES: ATP phosphoribosyltransferase regulatory subunit [Anaerostipes]MCI5623246.1 ATP phosphoribosyltransferase regulatory subunit [Anaerostipes sp.]MDY2726277.1 ATP phosphoribosyltransferase regulatory subunit [Anaerostipes faecalis]OLR58589.1 ATP phosphoribosyltransferase regulatory subunit [Anaerostipes sp. 494a]
MNKKRVHTPEGVRDVYGIECRQRIKLKEKLNKVFALYGYENIRTPGFEFFDVFNSEKGTVSSREMYKFFDREGNTLVLRPDVTPSIARCVAKYFSEEKMGIRLSYAGNVFLNNSSYQLKLKETCQLGAELVNDDSAQADSEVIAMAVDCFLASGLKDFRISIGEVEFFQGLTESICDEDIKNELRDFILNKNYFGLMEYVENLDIPEKVKSVFLRFNELNGDVTILNQAEEMVENETSKKALARLRNVYEILKLYGKEKYISFDLGMLNRHNYYTGIIFKGYTYGTGDAVLKGGRYDNLIEQFGKKAPSVGFAIVLDELMMALSRQEIPMEARHTDVMIVYSEDLIKDAILKAKELRKQGKTVILERKNTACSKDDYQKFAKDHHLGEILYFI